MKTTDGVQNRKPYVKTIEQARDFVLEVRLCSVFSDRSGKLPSLWDVVDYPEKQPGESGWGQKVSAVWTWKNELPARFPDDVFYGKIKGGRAVLMAVAYLRETHYPATHVPIENCSPLAQELYRAIRLDAMRTAELRESVGMAEKSVRNRFERALVELQVTLNIARLNDPDADGDTWVPFSEQYLDVVEADPAGPA